MGKVVGIRFPGGSKVYNFDTGLFVLKLGERVIVETEQGMALGEVAMEPRPMEDELLSRELKSVYRLANQEDLAQQEENQAKGKEAYRFCKERIAERKLDMNLVKVDCLFDRSKMIFYFTAENRVDFRELVRDLVKYCRTRVEMRQIGVRHEAKLLGGLGSCGRELCCATFLRDFEPVSVKMAKEQNLSLNPTKISGQCGRLMCCLTYEFPIYKEMKKDMPKLGKRVQLKEGLEARVIRQNVLEGTLTALLSDGREVTCTPDEFWELRPQGSLGEASRPRPNQQSLRGRRPNRHRPKGTPHK